MNITRKCQPSQTWHAYLNNTYTQAEDQTGKTVADDVQLCQSTWLLLHINKYLWNFPRNKTKGDERIAIMAHLHQYAPIVEHEEVNVASIDKMVQVTTTCVHSMLSVTN